MPDLIRHQGGRGDLSFLGEPLLISNLSWDGFEILRENVIKNYLDNPLTDD